PDLDRNLVSHGPDLAPGGPQWLDDGRAYSTLEDSGRIRVIEIQQDGTTSDLVGGDRVITGVSPRGDGTAFAFVASAPDDPGELHWWEDGEELPLTSLNAAFRDAVQLVRPERFLIEHEGVAIEGWIYLAPGDESVPVLFNIHGGPATQYGYGFFDEFQVYVDAGYGVVATNPRGSSGYGLDHVRSIVGTWQQSDPPDVRDLETAVDAAAAVEPRLDLDRVGIMGGSYGGLMTARLIGRSDRYRSAVAERGVYNFRSFAGTSDIGPSFTQMYFERPVAEIPDVLWAASPLALAPNVTTPTLLIHSETDHRAPIEQSQQLFAALLAAGVETEFAWFPRGQSHELSRSGDPSLRLERFNLILAWHDRYLKGDEAAEEPSGVSKDAS
ncbi:MAG: alpha/beta hydrolase family protein, partial [Acidimicrobiia bacterium]